MDRLAPGGRVNVQEIEPGLWRWTTFRPDWKKEVGCVFLNAPEAIVLFDPAVPQEPDEAERFWRHLDAEVAEAGVPVHVLITVFFHARSSRELVDRYSGRLWALAGARRRLANRAGDPTDVFELGDPLPAGIRAFDSGRRLAELIYWLPEQRALVAGDVLHGGPLRLCPRSWLPRGLSHDDLRDTLRPLLKLPVRHVLTSHGEPALGDGGRALAEVLARRP